MRVSHAEDHVTHAVIGGGPAIEFGISDSAAFFQILSSTLYKDQILAVVRETLCNAWDAHLAAGRSDQPVSVTLTSDTLTIQDFGPGIPHAAMGPIYGVYGGSTKANDGRQTGGFGLGCKAPFAYTEHFEVVSVHDRARTVYRLSKSSAQAEGKPSITPIVTLPSVEPTGLTVTIPLKPGDAGRFQALIRRIARNGDMAVTLNGERLPTLDFAGTPHPWLVHRTRDLLEQDTPLALRYGNVVYPIEREGPFKQPHDRITAFLKTLGVHEGYRILLQAPPHSVSVMPNREGLSMQPKTVATVLGLLGDFLAAVDRPLKAAITASALARIEDAVQNRRLDALLSRELKLPMPTAGKSGIANPYRLTTLKELAARTLATAYPHDPAFRQAELRHRLTRLVDADRLDRGLVRTFLAELSQTLSIFKPWDPTNFSATTWLHRRVLAPLTTKLAQTEHLTVDRLYVCDPLDRSFKGEAYSYRYSSDGRAPLVPVRQAKPPHITACLPYLRRILVLSFSRVNPHSRAFEDPAFAALGREYGFLVYHVGRKAKEIEAARAFFAAQGLVVIDLTQPQEADEDATPKPPRTPRKPRKSGAVALSAVLTPKGQVHLPRLKDPALEADLPRTDAPAFVVKAALRKDLPDASLPGFDDAASQAIVRLFGARGAVVTTEPQYDAWRAKGAAALDDFLRQEVVARLTGNPRVLAQWAFHPSRAWKTLVTYEYSRDKGLFRLFYTLPVFREALGIPAHLTQEDRDLLAIWDAAGADWVRDGDAGAKALKTALDAVPLDPLNATLAKLYQDKTFDCWSLHWVHNALVTDRALAKPETQLLVQMLLLALQDLTGTVTLTPLPT